jgi:D-lactate dehydrogenase
MRKGALLINVSRGGLVDTDAVLAGLRNGQLGGLAMDVYEHEDDLFFVDYTDLPMEERMKKVCCGCIVYHSMTS